MTHLFSDLRQQSKTSSENSKTSSKNSEPELKKTGSERFDEDTSETVLLLLEFALDMCRDVSDLVDWFEYNSKEIFKLKTDHKKTLRIAYAERQEQLRRRKNG